jgi:AcrR family transcriptional regulator
MNIQSEPVRTGRKLAQVLKGAREVFLRDGYEGASVDEIAKASRVSKATLYNYFPDKRILFLEVAKAECRAQSDAAMAQIRETDDIREAMTTAAKRMSRFFMSDVGMQVYRIVVGENQRFPELGREFFETGPAQVRGRLREFLQKGIDAGKLKIDDIELAVDQFPELCKAGLHMPMAIGIREKPTEEEIDRVVDSAVDMFLARYGV